MRRNLIMPVLGMLLLAATRPLEAQTSCTGNPCNVTTTATLTVNDVMKLTLSARRSKPTSTPASSPRTARPPR